MLDADDELSPYSHDYLYIINRILEHRIWKLSPLVCSGYFLVEQSPLKLLFFFPFNFVFSFMGAIYGFADIAHTPD